MTITTASLNNDTEWDSLRSVLESQGNAIEAVRGVLQRARELGSISVVIEDEYLDQDFTSEFSAFYSRVFKRFSKLCKRLHFFSVDVSTILSGVDTAQVAADLVAVSDAGNYVGYIVARPVQHAPLGRVVLKSPPSPTGVKSDLLVRSSFSAHLLGATLRVTGSPFTQQDSRIGACAQAAIWMATRHFQSRHHGSRWVSTVDITDAASKPTDHLLSLSLPAGSRGLTVEHMVRALRGLGREPLLYHGNFTASTGVTTWQSTIRPAAVIDRYVDSGIPVIVGLSPWTAGQEDFHAVLAVGHSMTTLPATTSLQSNPTRAEFAESFLVNDDQRGPALRMGLTAGGANSQTPYDQSKIVYLIIPLPEKVFTSAESAETVAWDLVQQYTTNLPNLKTHYGAQIPASIAVADEFKARIDANEVVARTYLTFGWRYKERIVKNNCASVIKDSVVRQSFPRFVWVTEFGTKASFNQLDEQQVQIFGHVVTDATSNMLWEGRCIFHAPGFLWRWYQDSVSPYDHINTITPIDADQPYRMKIRGQ